MTIAEILLAAAELIEPDGAWGPIGEPDRCTANLAIARSSAYHDQWRETVMFFGKHLGVYSVNDWESTPGLTQAEVVAALREAAKAVAT